MYNVVVKSATPDPDDDLYMQKLPFSINTLPPSFSLLKFALPIFSTFHSILLVSQTTPRFLLFKSSYHSCTSIQCWAKSPLFCQALLQYLLRAVTLSDFSQKTTPCAFINKKCKNTGYFYLVSRNIKMM